MLQLAEASKRSAKQINQFEIELSKLFQAVTNVDYCRLASVDYHPCAVLEAAAKAAGIDLGKASMPWKTSMYACEGKIIVYPGFHAEPQELI